MDRGFAAIVSGAMDAPAHQKLIVAISSRALFDLEASHRVYMEQGVDAYCQYQIDNEDKVLAPGVAFTLVKKLLGLNRLDPQEERVEVILLSRNSADTGLRVFNSIHHYNLDIARAAFSGGDSPFPYVAPFEADLFLTADADDVDKALDAGIAAATILPGTPEVGSKDQLRIAFDGDAVIFSDEGERVYQENGLTVFNETEVKAANEPLSGGPFKGFLSALHRIQSAFPPEQSPIRTALFTSRGAPAHERVIRTLRAWGIRIDEAVFLGGREKGKFLRAFEADIFFDDQHRHCDLAKDQVPTGHVPHGVVNKG